MELVPLTVVANESEAEVVCGALRDAGIECTYRPTDTAAAAWQGSMWAGPTEILVAAVELEAARAVLADDEQKETAPT